MLFLDSLEVNATFRTSFARKNYFPKFLITFAEKKRRLFFWKSGKVVHGGVIFLKSDLTSDVKSQKFIKYHMEKSENMLGVHFWQLEGHNSKESWKFSRFSEIEHCIMWHLHTYWWYFRCSWCLHVLKKIYLSVFVGSNQLYTHVPSGIIFPTTIDSWFQGMMPGRFQVCNIKNKLGRKFEKFCVRSWSERFSVHFGAKVHVFEEEL